MHNEENGLQLLQKSVIAGMLLNSDSIGEIFNILVVEDFDEDLRPLAIEIKKLNEGGITPDVVTVGVKNKEAKEILLEILNTPHLDGITVQEKIVEKATLLKQERVKGELIDTYTKDFDLTAVKDKIAKLEKEGSSKLFSKAELMLLVDTTLGNIFGADMEYPFSLLNHATRGISRGQYIIVAGRPSIGKSTLLDNIAEHVSGMGKRVLFASAEMSAEMITLRILSRIMKMNLFDYSRKTVIDETILANAKVKFPNLDCFSFGSVEALEKLLKRKDSKYDIVFVDYLQLLEPKKRYKSTYEKATFVSNELKLLTSRFNIPILVASQYSRVADRQQPRMSDLRDSGALEQDADVIISIWRSEKDADLEIDENVQKIRIDLLKNRNGYTFANSDSHEYCLMFKKDEFRFFNPAIEQQPLMESEKKPQKGEKKK